MRLALNCSCTDIEEFLGQFSHFGTPIKDLSRFSALCRELGNPQDTLKFIHIVGTNGKGSTAEYCACAIATAGLSAGKFTSPYVRSVCERIAVVSPQTSCEISCSDMARLLNTAADAAEKCGEAGFSQFEILNAAAFLYYAEKGVDYVVLEAGIGGTLDSTNVIRQPECAVITSIGLDHTKILGGTVEEIARSKCGIIKGGKAVAADGIPAGAMQVIRSRCECVGAELIIPDEEQVVFLEKPSLSGSRFMYKGQEYHLCMGGEYQISNALTAIEALTAVGFSSEIIARGLERAKIPARMELFPGNILLDGGHNPQAADAVSRALISSGCVGGTAFIGMMNTKDYNAFLNVILPCFESVVFCDGFAEGDVPAEELRNSAGIDAEIMHTPQAAVEYARKIQKSTDRLIYFGGSFYFAAAIRQLMV